MIQKDYKYPLLIIIVGAMAFLPFLGSVHLFDWDEINFAESSREMIVSGDYFRVMIGFEPFWEKPPLFFWLQAGSMQLFGINEFSARLPNAIFGIVTLLSLYYIGKKERNEQFGIIWALVYFASLLPHLYFKSGIIDPVFNYFIFTAIYFIYRTLKSTQHRNKYAVYAGLLIGLAVLTKGPVGLLVPILGFLVMMATSRFRNLPKLNEILLLALMVFLVSLAWYGVEIINNGPGFLMKFIKYQIDLFTTPVADHQQPFYYHFVVVLFGCFPMSVLALPSFRKKYLSDSLTKWMMTLFWVVMILFTIVTTKIVHYSSLAYLPLSFLATNVVVLFISNNSRLGAWIKAIYLAIGVVFGILLTALPLLYFFKGKLIPYIDDPFAVAGFMKPVPWSGYEYLFGLVYLLAVIVSFIYLGKQYYLKAIITMAIGTGFLLSSYMVFVLPKIEEHTQGSLIKFFQRYKNKDVYVASIGFYTYARFFYFEQPNDNVSKRADPNYLLNGDIDKPVLIVTKITNKTISVESHPEFQLLGEEGGYRFFLRDLPQNR